MGEELDIKSMLKDIEPLEKVNTDLVVNLLTRIVLVEDVNDLLVKALKSSIGLQKEFNDVVPNPEEWQNLVDHLGMDLQPAETVQKQKMFNLTCGIVGTP